MKKLFCILAALMFSITCFSVTAYAEEKIKVACVGDSITEGWASTNLDTQSYPAHLQNLLGDGYEVKNFGIGGRTAMKVAEGMTPYWNESFFTQSKSFEPDVVILMLGTNDVVTGNWNDGETYYPDLKALVEVYQGLSSSPKVYLATPSTAFDADHPDKLQNKAVPIVRQVAEETGATLVDINALTANSSAYYPDGIHPNDEGYYRLALMFYENVFDGKLSTLTLNAASGNKVHVGELTADAGADGKAELKVPNGKNYVTVADVSGSFYGFEIEVDGDKSVDCTSLAFPENLATSAAVTDASGAVSAATDANLSTGWQRTDNYDNAWLVCNFAEATEFNSASFMWEESTRAKKDDYKLEYSTDGINWTEVSNPSFIYSGDFDTVTFDAVTASCFRIKINSGISGKAYPKIFEMAVVNSKGDVTPGVSNGENETSSDITSVPEEGGNDDGNGMLIAVIAVAAVAVVAVAAVLVLRKKK